MKKLIALLLCVVMVLGMFAGCAPQGNPTTEATKPQAESKPQGTQAATQAPETTQGHRGTLKIGIRESTAITDYEDNGLTNWVEEQLNCDIEWVFFASNSTDAKTQLSTMVTGGTELPDIILNFGLGADLFTQYGQDGILMDISDLIEDKEKSAEFYQAVEEHVTKYGGTEGDITKMWNSMYEADGSGAIYKFPYLESTLVDTMDAQVYINQKWLDAVGMKAPTNTDELYAVLKAFKEKDPNGNGEADEIPMLSSKTGSLSGEGIDWLIRMFMYWDDACRWNVDENGKLYYPQATNEYREALKFINKLYTEGLLSPLSLTAAQKEVRGILMNTDTVGLFVGHPSIVFSEGTAGCENIYNFVACPQWGYPVINMNQAGFSTCVTCDAEDNIDLVWDCLMLFCTYDFAIRARYGVEGEQWDYADAGAVSMFGIPATIKLYTDLWATQGRNTDWANLRTGGFFPYAENEILQDDGSSSEFLQYKLKMMGAERQYYLDAMEKIERVSIYEYQPAGLIWTQEEKDRHPTRGDCNTAADAWESKFITGEADINNDADWNAYLAELDAGNITLYRDVAQSVFDRMNAAS